jgi:hypothetical protein
LFQSSSFPQPFVVAFSYSNVLSSLLHRVFLQLLFNIQAARCLRERGWTQSVIAHPQTFCTFLGRRSIFHTRVGWQPLSTNRADISGKVLSFGEEEEVEDRKPEREQVEGVIYLTSQLPEPPCEGCGNRLESPVQRTFVALNFPSSLLPPLNTVVSLFRDSRQPCNDCSCILEATTHTFIRAWRPSICVSEGEASST